MNMYTDQLSIKRAIPEDADRILEYLQIIGSETENFTFGEEGIAFSEEEERSYLTFISTSKTSAVFLAEQNGNIVGTASYVGETKKRTAHRGRFSISVKKSEWGKGIGSLLTEAVISFARQEAKAEIISLEVRSDNMRAIRLYRKYGFQKIGIYPGYTKIKGEWIPFDLMNLSFI